MSIIALVLIAILIGLAALHLYWGFGGFWPGTNAQSLAERVAGTSRPVSSKLSSCAMVAAALLAAAGVVLAGHLPITGILHALIAYGGYATLIMVFGLRGLAPYVTPAFNYARGKPFFELNRRYYAPLCLLIAAALVVDYPHGVENAVSDLLGGRARL